MSATHAARSEFGGATLSARGSAAATTPLSLASDASLPLRVALAARLRSLDAFRGITVAAMILVNNPGVSDEVYGPLRHAAWNGWTTADLIFPFFLFITGVAVAFSLDPVHTRGVSRRHLLSKIARRALLIFALGLFLNGFPLFDWSQLRIPGVLQRIALCYGAAALIVLTLGPRGQGVTAASLAVGYWLVMAVVPVPDQHSGAFSPDANLAAYLDDTLLHGHLLHDTWDPEGLLSTLPALATTLAGVLAGQWLQSSRSASRRAAGLVATGAVGIVLGLSLDRWCPINKNLWSSSYVVFTAGMALTGLAACYWLIDIRGYRRCALPFVAYGTNPIVAYVLSSLITKELLLWRHTLPDGSSVDVERYLFESFFLPLAQPVNASLLYATTYVLLLLAITAFLYRQRVLIKI